MGHEDDANDDKQEVMEEEARKPDVHENFQVYLWSQQGKAGNRDDGPCAVQEDPDVKIEENKEMIVFVKQFGGYAMRDAVWAKEAAKFAEELVDRADEVEFSPYITAGYDSPMKFWNRKNEVMF